MKVIKNALLRGEMVDIGIEDGTIVAIGKFEGEGIDAGGAEIFPGLIDIHTHGCAGKDTMEGELDYMSRYMLSVGTTTWYPTTMTVDTEDIIKVTNIDLTTVGGANIPGFHLEGPFINVAYKGAQNEKYVIPPTLELIKKCKNVKKITVAPEIEGAMEFIEQCDAVVSIGHSTCDYDTAIEAFGHGARCLTHTYNCMSPMHHRNPGPIPAGAESDAYAELICDGLHIHPAMVRVLMKLYGEDRVILISDSMRAAGLGDGIYDLGGLDITVKDGVALTENGKLAGSTTNVFNCVKKAISFGIDKYTAVKLATENPARLMGLSKKGKIEIGYDADFILVDKDFNLLRTVVRGEI